jgi:hypothetical protein
MQSPPSVILSEAVPPVIPLQSEGILAGLRSRSFAERNAQRAAKWSGAKLQARTARSRISKRFATRLLSQGYFVQAVRQKPTQIPLRRNTMSRLALLLRCVALQLHFAKVRLRAISQLVAK